MNDIPAVTREPAGPEDTPEKLEEERKAAQEFIDNRAHEALHLIEVLLLWARHDASKYHVHHPEPDSGIE